MKLTYLLLPAVVVLSACGGGGGGGGDKPAPIKANVDTNDIEGTWYTRYEPSQCLELYSFKLDGSFSIQSGKSELSGIYTLLPPEQEGTKDILQLAFTSQNREVDCQGDYQDVTGAMAELYVQLATEESMQWFELIEEEKQGQQNKERKEGELLFNLIRDNPLQIAPHSTSLMSGEQITLPLSSKYHAPREPQLLYGPDGMFLNASGEIEWQPNLPNFGEPMTVNVGVSSSDSLNDAHFTIEYTLTDAPSITARSGLLAPAKHQPMPIGDFDGDGKNELLLLSRNGTLSLVSKQGESYEQKWVYPFYISPSENMEPEHWYAIAANINGDSSSDILIAVKDKLYAITDLNKKATPLLEGVQGVFSTMRYGDIDADGKNELVFLNQDKFIIADLATNSVLREVAAAHPHEKRFELGNIDDDPQLEFVTASGYAIDSTTGELDWRFATPDYSFPIAFLLADVSGNGQKEVILTDSNPMEVLSIDSDKPVTTFHDALSGYRSCSALATNLDNDAPDEVILGGCSSRAPIVYHFNNLVAEYEAVLTETFRQTGIRSLNLGDLDNDALPELVWMANPRSAEYNRLVVTDLEQRKIQWLNESPVNYDNYIAAGVEEVTPGAYTSVFLVSSSETENYGQKRQSIRTLQLADTGTVSLSGQLSSQPATRAYEAVTLDMAGDGYGEVFIRNSEWQSDFLAAYELDSGTEIFRFDTDNFSYSGLMRTADFNMDGHMDVLATNESIVYMIDLYNGSVRTLDMEYNIRDIQPLAREPFEFVVALDTYGSDLDLSVVRPDEQTFQSQEMACDSLTPYQDTFICLQHGTATFVNESLDKTLVPLGNLRPSHLISLENGNLLAVTEGGYIEHTWLQLSEVDISSGKVIWTGPKLKGTLRPNSLHLFRSEGINRPRLQIATTDIMYVTH